MREKYCTTETNRVQKEPMRKQENKPYLLVSL